MAAFSRGSAAEKSDGSSSDEWKEKMAKLRLSGNASGIIPIPIAPTVLRVFYAWLRDRLFNASVAIVTDFGSNAVMDMDVFYPPRDDDDDDDDDDGADEDFEAMKAAMMMESGGASAVASTESQLATPVKSKDAIAVSSKESYIASPEPIVERGSEFFLFLFFLIFPVYKHTAFPTLCHAYFMQYSPKIKILQLKSKTFPWTFRL